MQNPTPPSPPVIIDGVDRTFDVKPGPSAIYEALINQREVLRDQLQSLENNRHQLNAELQQGTVQGASKVGVENRIITIDGRIADVEKQIATVESNISQTAAIPGAFVQHRDMNGNSGPPDEAFVLGGLFMIIVLLPLSIAMARRIWKRGTAAVTSIPAELMSRIARIEQTVESSAVEIERIGEGQRFVTKLFSESKVPVLPSSKDSR